MIGRQPPSDIIRIGQLSRTVTSKRHSNLNQNQNNHQNQHQHQHYQQHQQHHRHQRQEPVYKAADERPHCATSRAKIRPATSHHHIKMTHFSHTIFLLALVTGLILLVDPLLATDDKQQPADSGPPAPRSTQPTLERQLDPPGAPSSAVASSTSASSASSAAAAGARQAPGEQQAQKPVKPAKPGVASASQKKAAALASQQNYDKYQLKATNSNAPSQAAGTPEKPKEAEPKQPAASASDSAPAVAHKKVAPVQKHKSSFSLLKRLLPSFMSSAGPMAAAAATAAGAVMAHDKHQQPHSRSSPSAGSSLVGSLLPPADSPLGKASSKIINYLTSASKKSAGGGRIPDHAPFFVRTVGRPPIDRQAGAGLASSLLSNPLGLGLLFSAPLIPSLLLTPLALAGLSPAMSAINNFFGDDDEPAAGSTSSSGGGPLSALASGPNSPLASILQATGAAPPSSDSSSPSASYAFQAVQSLLGTGPPSTTERPLFNPGMFASQGIQNAAGSLGSSSGLAGSVSSSTGSGASSGSANPVRNFLGGNLIQTAASMISPTFAAPPSSAGSSSAGADDDRSSLMQMASDVFDKVATYMGPEPAKDIAQASGQSAAPAPSSGLASLVGLSSFSPFQLSSLLSSGAFGSSAPLASSSSSSSASSPHRPGFFSTLRNVYELFSSSFLRRQEVGDSNECQQRLFCELHQKAMNSKLFRRSLQTNLMELASLDSSLLDQLKAGGQQTGPMQARVDSDTKAMLNDFLKATNNFKNGRELVDCSKMFPKCSRGQLLSVANAHLTDPVNGRAIGKFAQLMKKMKFKSNQQHQSQWKLRRSPSKQPPASPAPVQYQPMDYLQVAPLSAVPMAGKQQQPADQLTPADSLKLVQQIMLMSQMSQQQQQQAYQSAPSAPIGGQYAAPSSALQAQYRQAAAAKQQGQQSASYPNSAGAIAIASSNSYAQPQYGPMSAASRTPANTYSDAIVSPVQYSATEAPYYLAQQQSVPMGVSAADLQAAGLQQQQQQFQSTNQQQSAPSQQQQQQQQQAAGQPSYQPFSAGQTDGSDGRLQAANDNGAKKQGAAAKVASAA